MQATSLIDNAILMSGFFIIALPSVELCCLTCSWAWMRTRAWHSLGCLTSVAESTVQSFLNMFSGYELLSRCELTKGCPACSDFVIMISPYVVLHEGYLLLWVIMKVSSWMHLRRDYFVMIPLNGNPVGLARDLVCILSQCLPFWTFFVCILVLLSTIVKMVLISSLRCAVQWYCSFPREGCW